MVRPACEKCGAPARVHVSNQLPGVGKVLRHYCFVCADSAQEDVLPTRPDVPPLSQSAVYLAAGVFVLLLTITADWIRPGEKEGFGAYQWTALLVSGLLVVAGAVMRATSILVVAGLMGVLTLLADRLKLGGVRGFGAYQIAGCMVGACLVGYGIWVARRGRDHSRTKRPSARLPASDK